MPAKKAKKTQKTFFSNTSIAQIALLMVILSMGYFMLQSPKLFPALQPPPLPASQTHQLSWPKVYTGVLPCGDCSGLATTLTLQNDGTYTLVEKYLGKETALETFGSWEKVRGIPTSSQATVYQIKDSKTRTITNFQQTAPNKLLQLDSDLKPINSPLNFTLTLN